MNGYDQHVKQLTNEQIEDEIQKEHARSDGGNQYYLEELYKEQGQRRMIRESGYWQEVKRMFLAMNIDSYEFIDAISRMIQEEAK